jgi:hypothetical protein
MADVSSFTYMQYYITVDIYQQLHFVGTSVNQLKPK